MLCKNQRLENEINSIEKSQKGKRIEHSSFNFLLAEKGT